MTKSNIHSNYQTNNLSSLIKNNKQGNTILRKSLIEKKSQKPQKNLKNLNLHNLKSHFMGKKNSPMILSIESTIIASEKKKVHTKNTCENSNKNKQDIEKSEIDIYLNKIQENMIKGEKKWNLKIQFFKKSEISPKMRFILIEWIIKIHKSFDMNFNSLFLAIHILEKYSLKNIIKKNKYQLVGLVCLWIASKYEEIYPRKIKDYILICDNAFSKNDIIETEKKILSFLNFDLFLISPLNFLNLIKKNFGLSYKFYQSCLKILVSFLLNDNTFYINCRLLTLSTIFLVQKKYNYHFQRIEKLKNSNLCTTFSEKKLFGCMKYISNHISNINIFY